MNLFKLSLKAQGFPIAAATAMTESIDRYSELELKQYHEIMKWRVCQHHINNNSVYQAHVKHLQISDWDNVPLLNKKDIQRPLDEVITSLYANKKLYRNNTSGSTGIPFHFAKNRFCHAMTWAYALRQYETAGIEYGKSLQARFFGIPLTGKKFYKEKLKDWFSARVRFPIFDLSDRVLGEYLLMFRTQKFKYIYGYTSSLVLFAKYVQANNVVLKDISPTLQCCIVTSEVCDDTDRLLLEKAFGVRVVNEYGAAELDVIAFEDAEGDFVLNENNLYIEVIDEEGRAVEPGAEGEVVVTALYNKVMPFIRYRLGDRVILKDYKKQGRRVIKSIKGRVNDVAVLPSGKKSPGLTFYYISKSLLEKGGQVKEFTIKQIAANKFLFEYVAESSLSVEQENQVRKLMDQYLEPGLEAIFQHVAIINRSTAGKFKHFQYLVK